jgi:hypothetical protein
MNSPVFDSMTIDMTMTKNDMNNDYSYNSFWQAFSFSQVRPGLENWEEFSFFELPRMKDNENDVLPPLILNTASKESGFFLSEDAEDAIRKRSSKELARKFQEIREEKMREDAQKEEIELQAFIAEQKAKALKEKAEKAIEEPKKNYNFKFFGNKKKKSHKSGVIESVEVVSARHSETRKKIKNEKKILDQARAEFFDDSSLINNEAWLVAIGEAIGMKFASRSIREIREKLNVSSLEKNKLVEKEDEITKVETSSLTDEQVSELNKAEKEDEEAIQNLASSFNNTFELAEKQREKEAKELELMISREKESRLFNLEISRAQGECRLMEIADRESREIDDEDDDVNIFAILKSGDKPRKKTFAEAFPKIISYKVIKKVEVTVEKPKIVVGATSFRKPKINRMCRNLKLGSEPCTKGESCKFLHNFDELTIEPCRFKKCNRVEKISTDKYINIEIGCKFIHLDETRFTFFVREGFFEDHRCDVIETKAEEANVEIKTAPKVEAPKVEDGPFILECNAWKEANPKIYIHPTQEYENIPTPVHKPVVSKAVEALPEQRNKTKMCDSITTGNPCRHAESCRFAHSVNELNITPCNHGEKCLFVKFRNGVFENSNGKFCRGIHPEESRENYLSRNGVVVVVAQKKTECCKLKTKICNTVIQGVKCSRRECNFAHNEKELNIRDCTFPSCKLIDRDIRGCVMNVNPLNKCSFFHKGETKSSYFQRLIM